MTTYSNAYLPFATGTTPNVITDSVYSTLTARNTGFQSGVAVSSQLNKVWRQSSVVSATFGQFCADFGGSNVVDDGNIANLEAQFEAALRSCLKVTFVSASPSSIFYVNNSTGSDANDGLSATVSGGHGPFATIQHAINTIATGYISTSTITVSVAYTGIAYGGNVISPSFISQWNFISTGGAAAIVSNSSSVFPGRGFVCGYGVNATINGFSITSYYEGIAVQTGGSVIIQNCSFNPPGSGTTVAPIVTYGGAIQLSGTITFANGTYLAFIEALQSGIVQIGYHDAYTTISVTLAYGTSTVTSATIISSVNASVTILPSQFNQTGSVTGSMFGTSSGGGINSNGGGTSLIWGTTAGTVTAPGWFL